jgi:hypothetical protein
MPMSNPNDGPLDLESIKQTESPPLQIADAATKVESNVLGATKALTAAQAAQKSHADHLKTLYDHIAHHHDECKLCRNEKTQLQVRHEAEKERAENFRNECTRLQILAWAVGWMMWIGNGMVALGSIAVGNAGCWPSMPDFLRYSLGAGGTTTALCGVVLTTLAFVCGRRAK